MHLHMPFVNSVWNNITVICDNNEEIYNVNIMICVEVWPQMSSD